METDDSKGLGPGPLYTVAQLVLCTTCTTLDWDRTGISVPWSMTVHGLQHLGLWALTCLVPSKQTTFGPVGHTLPTWHRDPFSSLHLVGSKLQGGREVSPAILCSGSPGLNGKRVCRGWFQSQRDSLNSAYVVTATGTPGSCIPSPPRPHHPQPPDGSSGAPESLLPPE